MALASRTTEKIIEPLEKFKRIRQVMYSWSRTGGEVTQKAYSSLTNKLQMRFSLTWAFGNWLSIENNILHSHWHFLVESKIVILNWKVFLPRQCTIFYTFRNPHSRQRNHKMEMLKGAIWQYEKLVIKMLHTQCSVIFQKHLEVSDYKLETLKWKLGTGRTSKALQMNSKAVLVLFHWSTFSSHGLPYLHIYVM